MNKRDTAYSAVKTFLVARGFSMEREDFEEFCTFVPAAGYSIGTVPAIKRLREITKGSVSKPFTLDYEGDFKAHVMACGFDEYHVEEHLGLKDAQDIVVFLRDNRLGLDENDRYRWK